MFRRLRGLLGLAVAWAIMWVPLGLTLAVIDVLAHGRSVSLRSLVNAVPMIAAVGAFCGFAFGLVFAAIERKRTFGSLSLPRFIAWGFVGAAIVPAAAVLSNPLSLSFTGAGTALAAYGLLGGISSAMTLLIARRAPAELEGPSDRGRLEPSE